MLKKLLFLSFMFLMLNVPVNALQTKSALIMEVDNGRVIFEQDAQKRLPMASTTKIMSAMITLEQPELDIPFTVDTNAIHVEGSSMGLREGDIVTLRVLAYGMLLPSGNDAANAAAVRIAGSKEQFVQMMNERAAEIGLHNTHFVTPSGLDDKEHYSTAYDMALLAREALQNQDFTEICGKSSAKVQFGNPPYDRWLTNHNKLLKYSDDVYGVKTGFTDSSGRCLVSAAKRDGVELIIVTLGCSDDWNTHMQLYETYFAKLKRLKVELPMVKIPVLGSKYAITKWCGNEITKLQDDKLVITITAQPFLFAPIEKGRIVGKAQVSTNNITLAEFDLVCSNY